MINLWQGKIYAQLEKYTLAKEHLSNVLNVSSAAYHQAEAKELLKTIP